MSSIVGMTPTGRTMLGPASDLVEVADADGVVHTAIVFHPEWRDHSAITDALGVIAGFLESPLVTGLVELVEHDATAGAFVYPTGSVRSVAELVRSLSDAGLVGGVRAGLELMYTAGQILVEGTEAGEPQGVYGHGGLTPRRIMIKPDGQVMVIGYGLPQVELLHFHEKRSQVPPEDSFRYCPPERMEGRPEALSSDLFGLGLIAFEIMTGKPVYDGLVNDIRQQAARGEGSRRLFRFREVLPEGVRNVLTKVLRPDIDARYLAGEDFLSDVHTLLADRSVPGKSLLGLMEVVGSNPTRSGGALPQVSTQMVSADALREQLTSEPAVRTAPVASEPPDERTPTDPSPDESPATVAAEAEAPAPHSVEADSPVQRWSKVKRQARRVRREASSPPSESSLAEPQPVNTPSLKAPAPAVPSPAERPPAEAESIPAPPRVPRPPRRSEGAPREPVPNATTADDLLLQIRGERAAPMDAGRTASERTAMFKRGEVMEVVVDDAASDDSATVMMTPAQLREKLAANLEAEPLSKGVAPPAVTPSETHAVQVLDPSGERHTVHVPSSGCVASAVQAMIGDVVPLPLDQMGCLQGWYRLQRDGERLDPMAPSVDLTGRPTQLEWIPSDTRVVEVSVRSGTKDVRFSNPMSTTVPVRSLVRFLAEWLSLPEGEWGMVSAGRPLDDSTILDDLPGTGPVAVELRVRDS